jgi:alkylated DNA repair dioxygenase AlkB
MPLPLDPRLDLFASEALPRGLLYVPDFLDEAEEGAWLAAITALPFEPAPYRQYTARRRIVSFGGRYDFEANRLHAAPQLPPQFEPLRARVAAAVGVAPTALAQVLFTEYAPGTPLGWHRDTPEFELVAGISLAADCVMRWRRWPPQKGASVLDLVVARRSLYVMREEARWGWQHAVAPTGALRYSITLRTLRG